MPQRGPAKDRKEFARLLAETGPILEYMERQDEIEAAATELEAHRSEFEQLATDEARYLDLVRGVFSEECFVPLRCTSADVRRAFDQVGYPATMAPDDRTVEIIRMAILLVADQERRHRYAVSLLHHLPEFVARGRHLEAWLLQTLAYETIENGQDPNPFLYEMFSYGYDAWSAEKRAQDESLLGKLGYDLDQLRAMKPDELDRIRRLVTDLRKYRSDRLIANDRETAALAMGAITYLEREDSPGLNTFLITLCWASLSSAVQAIDDSADVAPPEPR